MNIEFSPWFAWSERDQIPDIRDPGGVYILGRRARIDTAPDPGSSEVIYIGQTTRSVLYRLNRFDGACRSGSGHAGGNTYFAEYVQTKPDYDEAWLRLQRSIRVAVGRLSDHRAEGPMDLLHMGALKLAEVSLQVNFVRQHGRLPRLNLAFG